MRLAFLGTPDFAVVSLAAIVEAGHEVACVYSQPPAPRGRGKKLSPSPAQAFAEAHGLDVRTPASMREPAEIAAFRALNLDAAVVVAFGQILVREVIEAPRLGTFNLHASLLPRWRGAAPIQAAILAGDAATGITIMQMDAGLDTGAMLLSDAIPITATTTAAELHDALAAMGARLVLRALAENPLPRAQPAEGASYAPKLTREDGRIDWTHPAEALDRRVRALNPWPGTFTALDGEVLKLRAAEPVAGQGEPGMVLDETLRVATGAGALRITRLQAPGRAAMAAGDFLRGRRIAPGTRLG
jgi:methionyl-tRNA formyltransferase